MKITFFFRHPQCGFSIQRVFNSVIKEIEKDVSIEKYYMPSPYSMPWDILKNSRYTRKNRNKNGINHITGHIHDVILGLGRSKTVLTIHDLVFIDNVKNPIKRFYKWLFWLYFPVKFSEKVVCISEKTKNDVSRFTKTKKITVIPNPLDPMFKYVEKEFDTETPVILHIGTGWNKNLERTIYALEGIQCHLRIVGKLSEKNKELLKDKKITYSNILNLTDEEIREEYIKCDIVNFPSEYEGFGMPIIEGQKTGRIVVTSYIEPLIDVSGGAVQFVNPLESDSIREAYKCIIENQNLREELIKKGLKNVERFSVRAVAEKYMEVYKELMSK